MAILHFHLRKALEADAGSYMIPWISAHLLLEGLEENKVSLPERSLCSLQILSQKVLPVREDLESLRKTLQVYLSET
jgi:hypothetical protein